MKTFKTWVIRDLYIRLLHGYAFWKKKSYTDVLKAIYNELTILYVEFVLFVKMSPRARRKYVRKNDGREDNYCEV